MVQNDPQKPSSSFSCVVNVFNKKEEDEFAYFSFLENGQHQLQNDKKNPEEKASFVSRLTYQWIKPLFHQVPMNSANLFALHTKDQCQINHLRLRKAWEQEESSHVDPSLQRALRQAFWIEIGTCLVLEMIHLKLKLMEIILFYELIYLLQDQTKENNIVFIPLVKIKLNGYILTCGLFLVGLIKSWTFFAVENTVNKMSLRMKSGLCALVYEKTLCIPEQTRYSMGNKKILSLETKEIVHIIEFTQKAHTGFSMPIQLVFVCLFIWYLVQKETVVLLTMGVGVVLWGVGFFLSSFVDNIFLQQMDIKNTRTKMLKEFIKCIQLIKMYTWEKTIESTTSSIRDKEMCLFKQQNKWTCFLYTCRKSTSLLILLVIFFSTTKSTLNDPSLVLTVLLVVSTLVMEPFESLPYLKQKWTQYQLSISNIQEFLLIQEIEVNSPPSPSYHDSMTTSPTSSTNGNGSSPLIYCRNVLCPLVDSVLFLSIPFVRIEKNDFILLTGLSQSGKSTFLLGLMRELSISKGTFSTPSLMDIAYVSQKPWVFTQKTIEDNILCGLTKDLTRLNKILFACCLDQLNVNTKVSTFCQLNPQLYQQISLARALYADKKMYLIDEFLSTLEEETAIKVFTRCFQQNLLKEKTCILVVTPKMMTSFVLTNVQKVIVMNQLQASSCLTYAAYQQQQQLQKKTSTSSNSLLPEVSSSSSFSSSSLTSSIPPQQQKQQQQQQYTGTCSTSVNYSTCVSLQSKTWLSTFFCGGVTEVDNTPPTPPTPPTPQNILSLLWQVVYFKSTGTLLSVFFSCVLIGLSSGLVVFGSWYLVTQLQQPDHTTSSLLIYSVFVGTSVFCILVGTLWLTQQNTQASKKVHTQLTDRVLYTKMDFFFKTSIEQIILRFGYDMSTIDDLLNPLMIQLIGLMSCFLAIAIVQCWIFPWMGVYYLLLLLGLGFICRDYQNTWIHLTQLEINSKRPFDVHLHQSIQGIVTIRSLQMQSRLVHEMYQHLECTLKPFVLKQTCSYWLGLRLAWFHTCLSACIALFMVFKIVQVSTFLGGLVLLLTYHMTNQILPLVLTKWFQVQTELIPSIQRIDEYIRLLEPEEDVLLRHQKEMVLPSISPTSSILCLQGVSIKTPTSRLTNLTLSIKKHQKIALVLHRNLNGPTSGPTTNPTTSLIQALYRLIQIEEGGGILLYETLIQNRMPLTFLRSQMIYLAKEPHVLDGFTLRFNIDPRNEYPNETIEQLLTQFNLNLTLNQVMDVGQLNQSQKQLICLIRLLIRLDRIRIVFLESEAFDAIVTMDTTSATIKMDNFLRKQLQHCTVITIAPRLEKIMSYDQVVILGPSNKNSVPTGVGQVGQGERQEEEYTILEKGSPMDLLRQPSSLLRKTIGYNQIKLEEISPSGSSSCTFQ